MAFTELLNEEEKSVFCTTQIPGKDNEKLLEIIKELGTTKEHIVKSIILQFVRTFDKKKEASIKERSVLFNKKEENKSTLIPEI